MTRKIVHLVYSLGCGGLEQVIVNLINNSREYNAQHFIITLTEEQDLHAAIEYETPIYSLHKKPGKDFASHWRLFKLLREIRPQVLNTYNFGTMEYHPIAALAGIETQVHCDHGRGGDDSNGTSRTRNLLRRLVIPFLDKYVVVSPDLFRWGKEVLKLEDRKLQLVHNGVNVDQYKPSIAPTEKYTITTVGRVNPVKNQALLVNAYIRAINSCPALKERSQLLIAGDGSIFTELQAQVQSQDKDGNIKLLGYRSDVANILNHTDLFILSSLYEAMPMTVLEAMACETPVICTNVGGVPHLVSDKEGWLVPTKDVDALAKAIVHAFENPGESAQKAAQGRQLVEDKYSIAAMVRTYMAIYRCALAN